MYEDILNMLLSLFSVIVIAIVIELQFKQLCITEGLSSTPVVLLLDNNSPVDIMVIHYNRSQLLSLYSPPGKSIKLNNQVLSTLKEYGILTYRGKRAGRPRTRVKDTNNGVHWSNLTKIKTDKTFYLNENRKCRLHISTVNTRSVRGKSAELIQHVFEEKIDICVITETWLQPDGDDVVRGELRQDGYSLDDVPRLDRKGGGIALLHRENLKVSRNPTSNSFQSFEYAEWKVSFRNFVFLVVGVYRPPYSEKHPVTQTMFITEFSDQLENLSLTPDPIVILGDFNLHLDDKTDYYSTQFLKCLQSFGFKQHVSMPTHTSGHILDLIITRKGDKISDVSRPRASYFISDHCFASCYIQQCRPPLTVKTIKMRNWKSVSKDTLQNDFLDLQRLVERSSNVDELVSEFNKATSNIISRHAPLKEKTIICRPNVPWYTGYLKSLKQFKRTIEKIYFNDRTLLTEKVYTKVRNSYTAAVATAKNNYYQTRINEAEGNIKQLYRETSNLLGRVKDNPLPPHTSDVALANDFLRFFGQKNRKNKG